MVTKSKLISDIELRVTGGKPSDDLALSRRQISYWLDLSRDALVGNYLNDIIKKGNPIPTDYLEKETFSVFEGVDEDDDGLFESWKVSLSKTPLNLLKDRGIARVVTSNFQQVQKKDLSNIDWITDLSYCKADSDNLTYHREKNVLFIQGLNEYEVEYDKVTVYYVTSYKESPVDDIERFVIDDTLMDILLDEVEEIARRELYGSVQDLENDGEQDLTQPQ